MALRSVSGPAAPRPVPKASASTQLDEQALKTIGRDPSLRPGDVVMIYGPGGTEGSRSLGFDAVVIRARP